MLAGLNTGGNMKYAMIVFPAAPVRKKASHSAEMVNQLLFGETVLVVKSKKGLWIKIRSIHDGYEGWITKSLLTPIEKEIAMIRPVFAATDILSALVTNDRKMNIPFGSSLPFFKAGIGNAAGENYTYDGSYLNREEQKPRPTLLNQLTTSWLNVPYLWGGRTPLGVDCSGFTQVIFKLMGIDLPRDAWQQAREGNAIQKFSNTLPGDLAFFGTKKKIVHVGIILEGNKIVHSSGKVRVDKISKKGIVDESNGKLIYQLQAVRRIWEKK